jgi:hypothetical protein
MMRYEHYKHDTSRDVVIWLLAITTIVLAGIILYLLYIPHPISGARQRIEYIDSSGRTIAVDEVRDMYVGYERGDEVEIAGRDYKVSGYSSSVGRDIYMVEASDE